MRILIALAALFALSLPVHAADPKNPVEIKEWAVPFGGHGRDPDAISEKEVWFVGQRGDYLARFDATTGKFLRRSLDDGAGPHNLIVGADGIVWYSGNLRGYIGRYDPRSDKIVKISMPNDDAGDPHTLIFDAKQENIWFTVQHGNMVGRLNISSRAVDLIRVPTRSSRPYGIIMAPDGKPWIALFGTNKLASIDPATMKLTEHTLPRRARPRRLVAATNGQIFYADYRRGFLGRLDPRSNAVKEWPMPSGDDAQPYGMVIDNQDHVWFVATGPSPNLFVGFRSDREEFFSITPIPSGAGSVRHMDYHPQTGTVWFGTDEDTIGRAKIAK